MKKRELIQAFEKASSQTRCQANRMLDLLSGVPNDPFANHRPAKRDRLERPTSETDEKFDKTPD